MNEPLVTLKRALPKIEEDSDFVTEYSVRAARTNPETRRKLLEAGALVPGAGRTPDLYRPKRLLKVMTDFAAQRAADELARMEAAA